MTKFNLSRRIGLLVLFVVIACVIIGITRDKHIFSKKHTVNYLYFNSVKIVADCPVSDLVIKKYNYLSSKMNEDNVLLSIMQDPSFGNLEKIATNNDKCGTEASILLLGMYLLLEYNKENSVKSSWLNEARKLNPSTDEVILEKVYSEHHVSNNNQQPHEADRQNISNSSSKKVELNPKMQALLDDLDRYIQKEKAELASVIIPPEPSGQQDITTYHEKAKEVHGRLLNFAATNNFSAIRALCEIDTELTPSENRMHYCENVVESNDPMNDGDTKYSAFEVLNRLYGVPQANELIALCGEMAWSNKDAKESCTLSLQHLGKLAWFKNPSKTEELYKEASIYDDKGNAQVELAKLYFDESKDDKSNLNLSLYWYQEALKKLGEGSRYSRAEILDDMGSLYELLTLSEQGQHYVDAFRCYQQAASMGVVWSQLSLAQMYFYGHGTLKDDIQAYAWVSIAIAQGLPLQKRQEEAEQLKDAIMVALNIQDRNRNALKEAENLAKTYYHKYVLHEKPKFIWF
jgi:TPR repeat protein